MIEHAGAKATGTATAEHKRRRIGRDDGNNRAGGNNEGRNKKPMLDAAKALGTVRFYPQCRNK